tara:strand:- start:1755 stop:3221 length:1467 start_codon:yes stop_codon:yes gene_type:complete
MNTDELTEEQYEQKLLDSAKAYDESLPKIVKEFTKSAEEVSHRNGIPASICFFNLLGQVTKDFITIPNGRNHEDTRIHFCWIQTSGTGKSTLWNFIGPIANRTFKLINEANKHPPLLRDNLPMNRIFNTFGVTDYTDSVLIGGYDKNVDDDGEIEYERRPGVLEGNGLAHWDEFEYSGIFKQTQHKENSIVYLNTLMNSLAGESWIISKALTSFGGMVMECFCERSVLAMTYPPSNLNDIIAEKGVLQRMLLFVWDVPEFLQHKMRIEQIEKAGTVEEVTAPIDKYSNAMYKIYQTTQERFIEVNGDPLKTMKYGKDFSDILRLEYETMRREIQTYPPHVAKIAGNFTTRLLKILIKMSVLCSVASAPSIKNKEERFIVTGYNVRQAGQIVRKCYTSLLDWLTDSLTKKRKSIAENSLESVFIDTYNKMKKDDEGFVNKTTLLTDVRKKAKKSRAQIYRHFDIVRHKFEELKGANNRTYVKLIRSDEE